MEIPNTAKLNMKKTRSINIEKEAEFLHDSLNLMVSN
jgi:hypothetical protein